MLIVPDLFDAVLLDVYFPFTAVLHTSAKMDEINGTIAPI